MLSVVADQRLDAGGYVGVTTDYVLDETLTGLSVAAGHRTAVEFVDLLQPRLDAREILLFEVTGARRAAALALFRRIGREARRLSFTDCTSFAIMRELGIQLAFTADRHFHRAGGAIRPLLIERGGKLSLQFPE